MDALTPPDGRRQGSEKRLLGRAGKFAMIAGSMAMLAAGGQVQANELVVNGGFQMYKPETSLSVTAEFAAGNSFTGGFEGTVTLGGGSVNYSDATTGTTIVMPGWVNVLPGAGLFNLGVNGSTTVETFGSWGGSNGDIIGSAAPLGAITTNGYTLSAQVKGGGATPSPVTGGLTLALMANGVEIPPTTSVTPGTDNNNTFQVISRTYNAATLTPFVGQAITVRFGTNVGNPNGGRASWDNISLIELLPARMVTFGLPGNPAVVAPVVANAAAITLTVPFGADVTALAPTFTLTSGASDKVSGSTQNFTSPVVYTVSDGATVNTYTVTVAVAPGSSAKDILTFGPGAVISGTDIAWSRPFGTDVTTLAPVYTVSPFASEDALYPSGAPRDFTLPQTYTITAQDASTQTYTVTVTVPLPAANDNFAAAIALAGAQSGQTGAVDGGSQTGTGTAGATLEAGEPNPGASNTVWFKWTCPADGDFTYGTAGSAKVGGGEWDAIIGIYTGSAVNALTALGTTPKDTVLEESMTIPVTAGTTYYIQLAGYDEEVASNILLNWSFAERIYQAEILTFGPGAVVGLVFENEADIAWNLSPGSNRATLTPTFTLSPGATCTVGGQPVVSGGLVNFSGGPVVFTVTAQGASPIVNRYTVTAVSGKVVLWDVAGDGDWDTVLPNWRGQASGLPTTFADGDAAIFNKAEGGGIYLVSPVIPFSTTVGAAAGDYTFTGGSIEGGGSLVKEGSSTLTLAFANTYTGATVVNGGTLVANGNATIGGSTSFTVADGAVLRLSGATGAAYKWPLATVPLSGAGTVTASAPGLSNAGFRFNMSAFTGVLNLTGGQFSVNPVYSPGFVSPPDGTINVGNNTTLYLGWTGNTFNTTVRLSGGTDNGENLGVLRASTATLNGAVILATNSTIGSDTTLTMNAVISDEGNGFGFTKVGGGTLILTAANTYGGTTRVTGGTLRADSPGSLGGGPLSISSGKLNLNYVGTKTVASLTLGGTARTAPGTYGSVASLADFPDDTYFTAGSTGTVTVAVVSGFASWAATNAPGQTADQDHDKDGVQNGIEYFMGQTGSSFTAMPGLDATNTIKWAMNPAFLGTYEVQTSPDLGTWTNVVPRPLPAGGNLSYLLPPDLGSRFVRLLVTPTP